MNREIYGILVGTVTLLSLALPQQLFLLVVALLAFFMARELESSLGVKDVSFASFFSLIAFSISPALGGVVVSLFSLAYGYRYWSLEVFLKAVFILFYSSFFPSYIVHLKSQDVKLLLALVIAVWVNDMTAYYVGRKFGTQPLFPKISPKKSLEGFLSGYLLGTAVLATLIEGGLLERLLVAGLTILGAVFGDYFKSFIKRQVGIKDFSNLFGEHGGVVDRFDALVFCAPLFYFLVGR